MIRLGGIVLNNELRLYGLNATKIAHSQRRTLLGESVLQVMPIDGGRNMELVATENGDKVEGFFTQSQIDAIEALSATGASVLLEHPRGSFQVLIVDFSFTPVVDYVDPDSSDLSTGTVYLIEV